MDEGLSVVGARLRAMLEVAPASPFDELRTSSLSRAAGDSAAGSRSHAYSLASGILPLVNPQNREIRESGICNLAFAAVPHLQFQIPDFAMTDFTISV
ncbi:MAG TPA: hypothetical protein VIK52_12920 [Opitutaceae bacterium]